MEAKAVEVEAVAAEAVPVQASLVKLVALSQAAVLFEAVGWWKLCLCCWQSWAVPSACLSKLAAVSKLSS